MYHKVVLILLYTDITLNMLSVQKHLRTFLQLNQAGFCKFILKTKYKGL